MVLAGRSLFYEQIALSPKINDKVDSPTKVQQFIEGFIAHYEEVNDKFRSLNFEGKFYYYKDTLRIRESVDVISYTLNNEEFVKKTLEKREKYSADVEIDGSDHKKKIMYRTIISIPIEEDSSSSLFEIAVPITQFLFYKAEKGWDKFAEFLSKVKNGNFKSMEEKKAKYPSVLEIANDNEQLFTDVISNIKEHSPRIIEQKTAILAILSKLKEETLLTLEERKVVDAFHIKNYTVENSNDDQITNFDSQFNLIQKQLRKEPLPPPSPAPEEWQELENVPQLSEETTALSSRVSIGNETSAIKKITNIFHSIFSFSGVSSVITRICYIISDCINRINNYWSLLRG